MHIHKEKPRFFAERAAIAKLNKRERESMNISEDMLADLAGELGLNAKNEREMRQRAQEAAGSMRGKSEEEILSEILDLKEHIKKDPAAYQKQLRAIRALRGMMNPEQQARLDRVLTLLER